jgi:hypothetical protein
VNPTDGYECYHRRFFPIGSVPRSPGTGGTESLATADPDLRRCTAAARSALRSRLGSFLPHHWVYGCSMAKRTSFHSRRVTDIPAGPWVPHSAELISSPAWRARSIHVVRLLDRVELEYCAHSGRENGYLTVTYKQFVDWGIGRRFIKAAIDEAIRLGLLVVELGLYRSGARRQPSRYRLSYLKWKFVPAVGAPYYFDRRMTGAISDRRRRPENRVEWLPRVNHPRSPRVNSARVETSGRQSPISQNSQHGGGNDQVHHGCTTLYISVYLLPSPLEWDADTLYHTSSWRRSNGASHDRKIARHQNKRRR